MCRIFGRLKVCIERAGEVVSEGALEVRIRWSELQQAEACDERATVSVL